MSNKPLTPVPFTRYPEPTKSGLAYAGDSTGWFIYQQAQRGLWTPTLTATTTNPTLGTGSTQYGDYMFHAGWVHARFHIAFGSAGVAAGSGIYEIAGLPFAPELTSIGGSQPVGWVHLRDVGLSSKYWTCVVNANGTIRINDPNGVEVTNAAPWTWGASDNMRGEIIYTVDD